MRFFGKQKWSIQRSTSRINIWDGSVRGGKTVAVDFRYLQSIGETKENLSPGAIDIMVGKTLGSLKRNVINPIIELLGNEAIYYPGKQEFHVWDNIINTIGANDERAVGKIQGATVRKALGDEITLWPENFFRMLDSRMSMDESQLFGSTNPGPPNHYLKTDYIDRKGILDLSSFHFVIDDNVYLSKKFLDEIKKSYTGLWFKRYILGLWCVAEGAIFDFFDEDEHTLKKCPKANYYLLGVDYGTANPFAAHLYGVNYNSKPKIWQEHEYYYDSKKEQNQQTDSEYSVNLIDFCKEYLGKNWKARLAKIYIDPSAESFQLQLEKDGFLSVTEADNSVMDGLRTVSTMLKAGDYAISVNCPYSIEEMYGYMWDEKKQEKGEDAPKKENDHCRDDERYVLHTEFGGNTVDLNALIRK